MKIEVDMPEHHYNNIMAFDSVNLGRVPYKGIIMYAINAIKHGRALEQEPKTGHWIKYGIPRCGEQHYKCTNCDEYFNFGLYSDYYKKAFKFCPNCGCRMIEPQESEGT